jgi:hypothetical protein
MKAWIFFSAVLIVGFGFSSAYSGVASEPAVIPAKGVQVSATIPTQQLQEEQGVWDFGKVKEGAVYAHDFILKNPLQKPLNIRDVSTSCGCTVSQMKKKTLEPGEETPLSITFNSKGYLGFVQQYIYVQTDDLASPILRYTIKADVEK